MAFSVSRSVLDRESISASIADNLSFAHPKVNREPDEIARIPTFWSELLEVIWNRRDDGALAEQELALQEQGALVVQQLAPPRAHDEFRHDHGDEVVLVAGVELVDETQDRTR